jgi:hypothetical protein
MTSPCCAAAPTGSGGRRLTAADRATYSPISDYNLFQPSAEAQELGAAVERWRRRNGRQPDLAEVLAVARQLGWRKAACAGEATEGDRPDAA